MFVPGERASAPQPDCCTLSNKEYSKKQRDFIPAGSTTLFHSTTSGRMFSPGEPLEWQHAGRGEVECLQQNHLCPARESWSASAALRGAERDRRVQQDHRVHRVQRQSGGIFVLQPGYQPVSHTSVSQFKDSNKKQPGP